MTAEEYKYYLTQKERKKSVYRMIGFLRKFSSYVGGKINWDFCDRQDYIGYDIVDFKNRVDNDITRLELQKMSEVLKPKLQKRLTRLYRFRKALCTCEQLYIDIMRKCNHNVKYNAMNLRELETIIDKYLFNFAKKNWQKEVGSKC